jgi:predicted MFS family arabinose efflux permease
MLGDMYDEKHRATAITLMTTVMGVGQIAGPLLGGFVGPVYGWRLPFILASAPNLLFLILFYIFVHEPKRGAGEDSIKEMIEAGLVYPRTIKLSDYARLAQVKTNIFLIIQGIIGMIPWGALPLFIVKFLNEHKGLSIQEATFVFMLFGAGNVIGTIVGGEIGGILMKHKAVYLPHFCTIANLAGTILCLIMFAALPPGTMISFILIGFIAACLISVTGPNVRTMIMDINVPENRGAIFSIFNLTDSVGAGIGPFFAGNLSVLFGLKMAMISSVAVWLPCALLMWITSFFFVADLKKEHQKISIVAEEMSQLKPSSKTFNM